MSISVVVADDDADVRAALSATLADDTRYRVIAEAASGPEAIAIALRERPDVVLLDVRMPGGGVQAAEAIHAARPGITLVVVSARVDATGLAALVRAGVRGVFVKGRLGDQLPDLVARCCAGEVLLATSAAAEGLRLVADAG